MGLLSDLGPSDCSRCFNARRAARKRLEDDGVPEDDIAVQLRMVICDTHQAEVELRRKMDRRNETARARRARQRY